MNPLIKPAFSLMNRLSYRNKFALIASLFTIPLILLSVPLAFNYHTQADQALATRKGMEHFQEATLLIKDMEKLRDTSLVYFVQKRQRFENHYLEARDNVQQRIDTLKTRFSQARHLNFLEKLATDIDNNRLFPGNEGARIHVVFQNANILVEQIYLWRLKLSYEFVSKSSTNPFVIALLDIVNNSYTYLFALGEARAFGSFYLQQQFIDSQGIELVDNTFQTLNRLARDIEVREAEYEALFTRFPALRMERPRDRLEAARDLLDEQLIQAITPDGDPIEYFNNISNIVDAFHRYNQSLLRKADELLLTQLHETRKQLTTFYAAAVLVISLLAYLFIGFFSYIRVTIKQLVSSAQRVARGEYKNIIEISARDELQLLAKAMDEMRLKLKAREDELTEIGQTDGLTQLKNRKFFDESFPIFLSSSSRHNTPLCVVMMDIDHFKAINDTYGHQAGDYCLKQTADLFRDQFKRQSDIVARYGGEEFIAILYGSGEADALRQTEELRRNIEQYPFQYGDIKLSITASFGIAALEPGIEASESQILGLADEMLYRAKNEGRNRVATGIYPPPEEKFLAGNSI